MCAHVLIKIHNGSFTCVVCGFEKDFQFTKSHNEKLIN